jgi:hypothetical protein
MLSTGDPWLQWCHHVWPVAEMEAQWGQLFEPNSPLNEEAPTFPKPHLILLTPNRRVGYRSRFTLMYWKTFSLSWKPRVNFGARKILQKDPTYSQINPVQFLPYYVGVEALTAAFMNVAISWYIASCSQYASRRFGGTSARIRAIRRYIPANGTFFHIN